MNILWQNRYSRTHMVSLPQVAANKGAIKASNGHKHYYKKYNSEIINSKKKWDRIEKMLTLIMKIKIEYEK